MRLPRNVPGWATMTAVRTGRVYAVDGNAYLNRSGPRLVDSLEILAHLLHPNLIIAPPDASAGWRSGFAVIQGLRHIFGVTIDRDSCRRGDQPRTGQVAAF